MRDGYPAPIDHFTQGTTGCLQQRSAQCLMRKILVYLLLEACGIRVYPFCVKKPQAPKVSAQKKVMGCKAIAALQLVGDRACVVSTVGSHKKTTDVQRYEGHQVAGWSLQHACALSAWLKSVVCLSSLSSLRSLPNGWLVSGS